MHLSFRTILQPGGKTGLEPVPANTGQKARFTLDGLQPHELPILHVANQESTGNLTFLPLDCVKTPTSYSGEAAKIGQNKTDKLVCLDLVIGGAFPHFDVTRGE